MDTNKIENNMIRYLDKLKIYQYFNFYISLEIRDVKR